MNNSPPYDVVTEKSQSPKHGILDLDVSNSVPRNDPAFWSHDHAESAIDEEEEEVEEAEGSSGLEASTVSALCMSVNVEERSVDPLVAASDGILITPYGHRSWLRMAVKRKKGKSMNPKKLKSIKGKLETLTGRLNPIPFIPNKDLDFVKHEALLKKLSLWDFVHIDYDKNIRVDLISQLVATYEPKVRAGYVNGFRIPLNKPDLARAFRLPLKKEKGNVGAVEVKDLDSDVFSDDSFGFVLTLFSDWFLLHEDTWMMPKEVNEWMKLINDGNPERVDWAALFWLMVEKELKQGANLKNCYYASHLQHLIKVQRGELLLTEEPIADTVELDSKFKEEKEENQVEHGNTLAFDAVEKPEEEEHTTTGPCTELTLGQDGNDNIKDSEIVDAETCEDNHENGGGGEEVENGQWLLDSKNGLREHFLQPCSAVNGVEFRGIDDEEEEEEVEEMDDDEAGVEDEEEEEIHKFHDFGTEDALEDVGFTGNLLQDFRASQMVPESEDHLHSPSINIGTDMQQIGSNPSFYSSSGKRVLEQAEGMPHLSMNESNKRSKMNDPWNNQPIEFGMCMEGVMQYCGRAKMLYDEREQTLEQLNLNQEIMMAEVQKRDNLIEHLHKSREEDLQKKNEEIYRLERELYLMSSVLDGYRKALKGTEKLFAEYRAQVQLPEEPTYKDYGSGGIMLTDAEIERLRIQAEEELCTNRSIFEQIIKDAEQDWITSYFTVVFEKLDQLNKRLTDANAAYDELLQVHGRRKAELLTDVESQPNELQVANVESVPETKEESTPQIAAADLLVVNPHTEEETQATAPESAPETREDLQLALPESAPQINEEEVQAVKESVSPPDE